MSNTPKHIATTQQVLAGVGKSMIELREEAMRGLKDLHWSPATIQHIDDTLAAIDRTMESLGMPPLEPLTITEEQQRLAREAGKAAHAAGLRQGECPYMTGAPEGLAAYWHEGWGIAFIAALDVENDKKLSPLSTQITGRTVTTPGPFPGHLAASPVTAETYRSGSAILSMKHRVDHPMDPLLDIRQHGLADMIPVQNIEAARDENGVIVEISLVPLPPSENTINALLSVPTLITRFATRQAPIRTQEDRQWHERTFEMRPGMAAPLSKAMDDLMDREFSPEAKEISLATLINAFVEDTAPFRKPETDEDKQALYTIIFDALKSRV
jgi:hypothetical protein